MIKNYVILLLTFSATALAAPSSNRTLPAQFLKNGTSVLTVPSSGNDVLVGRATTDTLSNKSIDGGSNTLTNIPATTFVGLVPVANGGTHLGSGTSGGVLAYTATGTLASSVLLTANQLVIGGGAGVAPGPLAAGSQYQPLVMGASNPGYAALDLSQSAAVTNALGIANGGTNNASLAVTNKGLLYTDGTKVVNSGTGSNGQIMELVAGVPAWATVSLYTTPTKTVLYSTGTTTAYLFLVSCAANFSSSSTWTNNGQTFTATTTSPLAGVASQCYMPCTGTGAPILTATTLTKSTGSGDATITTSSAMVMATYTTPASAKFLKVTVTGGGGGGGGTASIASDSGWGSNGNAGATGITWITTPAATYYYAVGAGGAGGAIGNNAGANGGRSFFLSAPGAGGLTDAQGGVGGPGATGGTTALTFVSPSATVAVASGQDLSISGGLGSDNILSSGTAATGTAKGGASFWGQGGIMAGVSCNAIGVAGTNYGSGGTGGCETNNGGTRAGGAGSVGILTVEEYY